MRLCRKMILSTFRNDFIDDIRNGGLSGAWICQVLEIELYFPYPENRRSGDAVR